MSDKFSITGSWQTSPQTGALLASGAPSLSAPINEVVTLAQKNFDDYLLSADAVVPVQFGGVANANVIEISCDRKIKARFTSADGAVQVMPIDGHLSLISKTVPYTAIDLQRVAGQETRVKVFIGQKS